MPRRRKTTGLSSLFADAVATATTLTVRVPQLLSGTMTRAESRRMGNEKGAAAQQGWVDAARVAGRLILQKPKLTRTGATAGALAIVGAAIAPARRTVRANARRLGKRLV